jgi:ribonuclease BN (tRNA processing enzyme)
MKVKFYGTRGSISVAGPNNHKYGGNTTCVKIDSTCLPDGMWLVVDAGTGIVPLSWDFMKAGGKSLALLLSHFHHDHTGGLLLTHFPYMKHLPVDIYGPYEHGTGPRQVYQALMQPPYFPVHFKEIGSHIQCHNIEFPNSTVMVIHPQGGVLSLSVENYERPLANGRQLSFPNGGKYDIGECLVIRMFRSNHPEQTIAYRFEEKPTGRTFVFVTDHENEDGLPGRFRQHLEGADVLVMDCQYSREKYDLMTAGFGHATPDYVAGVARQIGVSRLGLTHHDPPSTDEQIDAIVATCQSLAPDVEVFGCADYLEVEVEPARTSALVAGGRG